MATFSVLDIALLLGISQGFFLAVALFLNNRKNYTQHRMFSFVLLLAVVMLIGRMGYVRYFNEPIIFRLATMVDSVVFLFGPLMLAYHRRLLFKQYENYQLNWKHFIPAALHLTFVLSTFRFEIADYHSLSMSGAFSRYYLVIEIAGLASNIGYWIMSFKLIDKFIDHEHSSISFEQASPRYLRAVLWLNGVILLAWMISIVSTYWFQTYSRLFNYDVVWVAIPIAFYLIGFYILRHPELLSLPVILDRSDDQPKLHPVNDRLSVDEAKKLKSKLDELMESEQPYLNSNLRLRDLASMINASSNDLSWLLNSHLKSSFYEVINKARVEEFVRRLKNGELKTNTILDISYEVGFNSKSSFNKVFKSQMNTTPRRYIKSLQ